MEALNAARQGGASYADARVQRQQQNFVFTREQQIQNVVDTDSIGIGVRALVDGTWGFAATQQLTREAVGAVARQAVAVAKANRLARDRAVELAPAPAHPNATWKSAYQVDPWTISIEEKVDLLLKANAEAMMLLNRHRDALERLTQALLEQETLDEDAIYYLAGIPRERSTGHGLHAAAAARSAAPPDRAGAA